MPVLTHCEPKDKLNSPAPAVQTSAAADSHETLASPRQVAYHYAPFHSGTALLPTYQEGHHHHQNTKACRSV